MPPFRPFPPPIPSSLCWCVHVWGCMYVCVCVSCPHVCLACSCVRAVVSCLQGNEGSGLRTNVIRECDSVASIPLQPDMVRFGLDSLNVSVAGGILLSSLLLASPSITLLSPNPGFHPL